ncbi:MAG: TIGR04219 family outer membrane beta-barrel protein [Pseudomonadales bacterium]
MKKLTVGLFAGLLLPLCASADLLGFHMGGGIWQKSYAGDVRTDLINIDLENDFGVQEGKDFVLHAAFEHPLPGIPNIRVQYVPIVIDDDTALTRDITFGGIVFPATTPISTDIDLQQFDATLYWEVLDNIVSLDVGLTVRYVDGSIEVASLVTNVAQDFVGPVPMLYGAARFDLPVNDIYVRANLNGTAYAGNSLLDGEVAVGWDSPLWVGVEVGYRTYLLTLDNVDDFANVEIDVSGFFASVTAHF